MSNKKYLTAGELLEDDTILNKFKTAQNIGYFVLSTGNLIDHYKTSRNLKINKVEFYQLCKHLDTFKKEV